VLPKKTDKLAADNTSLLLRV